MCPVAKNASLWRRAGFTWPSQLPHLNVGARGLFTNSCQASFCPCCPCQGSILLTDRLQQMVLEVPGGILQTGFDDLFFTGEWVTRAAQSYTNQWDGGFPWLQALLSSVEGPMLKKIWIFIYLTFKHFFIYLVWKKKHIYIYTYIYIFALFK